MGWEPIIQQCNHGSHRGAPLKLPFWWNFWSHCMVVVDALPQSQCWKETLPVSDPFNSLGKKKPSTLAGAERCHVRRQWPDGCCPKSVNLLSIHHLAAGTRNPQEPKTCRALLGVFTPRIGPILDEFSEFVAGIPCWKTLQKPLGEFEMPHHFKNIGEHVSMGNEDTHVFSGKEHDLVSGWQIKTYHYLFLGGNPVIQWFNFMAPKHCHAMSHHVTTRCWTTVGKRWILRPCPKTRLSASLVLTGHSQWANGDI